MKTLRLVCVCLLLAATVTLAGDDIWDKETASWSRKDADRILNSSPWGRRIATKEDWVKEKDKSEGRGNRDNSNPFDRGDLKEDDFAIVWWWSANTPRRAYMRIYELSGGNLSKEQAEQFMETKATAYLVSLTGGGQMVAISGKLPPDDLKKAAWLHSPRLEKNVQAEEVEVVVAGGRVDRIVFKFPQEVDGNPLITADDKRLLFRWKLPKSPKEKLDDAKQFEAAFEPKKMVARGEVDY